MPQGEIETHPYLEQGNIKGATKLILGSFPVYECTHPDNQRKSDKRIEEGTSSFFYGSVDSAFWRWYRTIVDPQITLPPNPDEILPSLMQRKIAISDIIKSCERYKRIRNKTTGDITFDQYSSEDSALHVHERNVDLIQSLVSGGVQKVLCTSKGVLGLLEKQIICTGNPLFGSADPLASSLLQEQFINELGGNNDQIANSIARVFIVNNNIIRAIAIPSPGSPQRQLKQFGFNGDNWELYANSYFEKAFNWLLE